MSAAARQAGLARGAYAAEATLAIARGAVTAPDVPLADAVHALDRAALGVRRIGVNLNQAVAKLNATGQWSGDLPAYAEESVRRAARLEAAGEDLRKRFLRTIRAPGPRRRPTGEESAGPSPVQDDRTAFRAGPPRRGWSSAPRSARPGSERTAFRVVRNTADGVPPARSGGRGRVSGDREGLPARSGRGRADPLPVRPRTPGGTHRPAHHRWLPAAIGPGTPAARQWQPGLPPPGRAAPAPARRARQMGIRQAGLALLDARRPRATVCSPTANGQASPAM